MEWIRKYYTCHDVDVIACHFLQKCLRISIGGRHLVDKQTKRFSRDRGIANIHGIVTIPRGAASFSCFLNIIFITVAFEAIEHGRPSNRAIYKCFGQWLFCFNCLFTNLLGLGPPIADSWHIQFSRRKWRHI